MIYRIDSHNTGLITRVDLPLKTWSTKFDRFVSVTGFMEDIELVKQFTCEFNLNDLQVKQLKDCLNNSSVEYYRYSNSKYEHFKIEPVYLDIKNTKGNLIYWKDWDFIFQKIENNYYLWCFLGGIADVQREIKLSTEQVNKFEEIGLAQIDYLVNDLKKLNHSQEYESAIKEERKIL